MQGDLSDWIARVSSPGWIWYVKYIPANDTYAKPNVHQGGVYLAKELLARAFPKLSKAADKRREPELFITSLLVPNNLIRDVRVVWYNSGRLERRPGKRDNRDEARITGWGGRRHPIVAEDATGSLVALAFHRPRPDSDPDGCEIWICRDTDEEDLLLGQVGPVEPGEGLVFQPGGGLLIASDAAKPCTFADSELDPGWRDDFPSGDDILEMALQRLAGSVALDVDKRLMHRRDCEYSLFLAIERFVVMPRIKEGFASVEEFVAFANAVTNRRKSRSGKSLELHARTIFLEEGLNHSWGATTEGKHVPDFVFPSIEQYHAKSWPKKRLRMLAAKTTCKDRWRQIRNEADRIPLKHLLTLQRGVSEPQFREMEKEGVMLVVPKRLHRSYPTAVQPKLLSLAEFIRETAAL